MNRGDVSALVSAFLELFSTVTSPADLYVLSSARIPVSVKVFLNYHFCLTSVDHFDLVLSPKISSFLL